MANQDFDINIRTLADLTGIKLTQAQLEALQSAAAEGNQKAANALRQLADAQKKALDSLNVGMLGSAAGIGTIISLVTTAITKWEAFNDELDKQVENMIKAEEKTRALGEAILDMQDAAISARRIDTEPLEVSYARLRLEIIKLKTEMTLLDLPTQGEDWKKLNKELSVTESQLHKVTSAMEKLAKEKERAAAKETSERRAFEVSAYEAEAKEAEAAGDTVRAQKAKQTAEALKRGIPREELIKDEIPKKPAGIGESQALVDEIERNRKAFFEQQIPKKLELDPSTGGMREVPLSIKETNSILKQILDQWK